MKNGLWLEGALSLLFVFATLLGSGEHLRRLIQGQTQTTVRGIQKVSAPLLEKANHAKDDLALQSTVQALSQIPGLAAACVVDLDGKVLAHTQPSQIGSRFQRSDPRPLWALSLHEGATKWGCLLISYSDRPLEKEAISQMILESGLALTGWVGFIVIAYRRRRQRQLLIDESERVALQSAEHNRKIERTRLQTENQKKLSDERLQRVCEKLLYPTAVLDQRQWVVAVNQSLLAKDGAQQASGWIGKSWQEIPALMLCGPAIERSRLSPRETLEVDAVSIQSRWKIQTLSNDSGAPIGTLMTLIE